jgi:hypothetical protein
MSQFCQNPFLFACGVPRSGTTLLQRMLDGHPELAVANDTHFIPRALELTDKSLLDVVHQGHSIPLTTELANQVYHYHRFYRLGITPAEFDDARRESETYRQLVAGLYDRYARKRNKPFGGEKTPDYVRRLGLLHALFPSAKLIHLVRDGRDVALSLLGWATPAKGPGRIALWNETPIAVCALWWSWMVMASRRQAARIDPAAYLEVHYEALVAQPQATLQSICDFLKIDYHDQMANFHRGKSHAGIGLSAKNAWLPPQRGLRDWRREMQPEQIQMFEALVSDALEQFGYEPQFANPSASIRAQASEYRQWWSQHFLPKHKRYDSSLASPEIAPSARNSRFLTRMHGV